MILDRKSLLEIASKGYKKDFNDLDNIMLKKDLLNLFMVRKMIKRFLNVGTINEKLILNNIIISLNIFGIQKTNILFRSICNDQEFGVVKACLIFLKSYHLVNDHTRPNHIIKDILNDISHRYYIIPKDEK